MSNLHNPTGIESSAAISADVIALLKRIPLFIPTDTLSIEPLQNVISLNNTNYRITVRSRNYLLRVASDAGQYLGIRREEEIEAARAAASIGIAPEILYAEPAGHMLMPWITGRHWEQAEFHQPENIIRIGETLRQLHSIKTVQGNGSVFRRIEQLLQSAQQLQQEMPPHLDAYLHLMSTLEFQRRGASNYSPGLAHNDFWANNFLDDGRQLWLVDWEFSGNADGLYDLATISVGSQYTEAENSILLQAYGDHTSDVCDSLEAMKSAVFCFEAAWSLVQHGLRGSADYNYHTNSARMFERLNQRIS